VPYVERDNESQVWQCVEALEIDRESFCCPVETLPVNSLLSTDELVPSINRSLSVLLRFSKRLLVTCPPVISSGASEVFVERQEQNQGTDWSCPRCGGQPSSSRSPSSLSTSEPSQNVREMEESSPRSSLDLDSES
jgi:hypothetical protein